MAVGKLLSGTVIVPLGGGALVIEGLPIDPKQIIALDCKRIPLQRGYGEFGFGMKRPGYLTYLPAIQQPLTILEIAVASGITTSGILLDLRARNLLPDVVQVITPVLAQPGYQRVQCLARILGVRVHFTTARLCYRLGDFYKERTDSVLTDNGRFVIGKATEILEPYLQTYLSRLENRATTKTE